MGIRDRFPLLRQIHFGRGWLSPLDRPGFGAERRCRRRFLGWNETHAGGSSPRHQGLATGCGASIAPGWAVEYFTAHQREMCIRDRRCGFSSEISGVSGVSVTWGRLAAKIKIVLTWFYTMQGLVCKAAGGFDLFRAQKHPEKIARIVGVGDHVQLHEIAGLGQFRAHIAQGREILDGKRCV